MIQQIKHETGHVQFRMLRELLIGPNSLHLSGSTPAHGQGSSPVCHAKAPPEGTNKSAAPHAEQPPLLGCTRLRPIEEICAVIGSWGQSRESGRDFFIKR